MRTDLAVLNVLFAIAAVGTLAWNLQPLDGLGIAIALALVCIDQGRMAVVDLSNIRQTTLEDTRVKRFYQLTWVTIILELLGFFIAWLQLGVGTAVVLISQLLFNALAKIQLYPGSPEPIRCFTLKDRSPMLIINAVGLGVIITWQLGQLRSIASAFLLIMVLVYLGAKYLSNNSTHGSENNNPESCS